jgi:hypothetical protein
MSVSGVARRRFVCLGDDLSDTIRAQALDATLAAA